MLARQNQFKFSISRHLVTSTIATILAIASLAFYSQKPCEKSLSNEESTSTVQLQQYLELKAQNPLKIEFVNIGTKTQEVLNFYKSNYANRNIVIFTDASWDQNSGVITVMKILQQKIKQIAGLNVVYVTPEDFKWHFNSGKQDIRVAFATEKELLQKLQTFNPGAIHIMVEGSVGFRIKNLLGKIQVPYTTAYHTDFPKYVCGGMPFEFLNKLIIKLCYKILRNFHQNSQAIMISTDRMRQVLKENGFNQQRIASWSHGVEINRFHPELRDENVFQKAFNNTLSENCLTTKIKITERPISLYVGRIEEEKNLEDFLKMKTPGTKVLIGDGKLRSSLQEKYPDAVFLGQISYENLPAYYALADIFVFPSFTDTFGLVLLEAAASGTPVLAYNVQGPADVIGTSPMGILVPFETGNSAQNIHQLETNFDRALNLNRRMVRAEAEKHSWETSIIEFLYFLAPLSPEQNHKFGVQPQQFWF